MTKKKLIYCSTVPTSLNIFFKGWLQELSNKYDMVAISSPTKELDEVAEREGIRCIAIEMKREINPIADIRALRQLVRTLCQEHPDAVHSFTPKAGLLCMMAAWIARVPVRIHTFTGLVWPTSTGLKRLIIKTTDRITCFCATHIIPEGEGVKQDLIQGHITRKPLQVLGYGNIRGVDMEYWKPKKDKLTDNSRAIYDNSRINFIFIGRLVRDKGINELIAAFIRLHQQYSGCTLTLVGWYEDTDPLLPETQHAIDTNPSIHFVDRQDDVRPYYEQSDCLVFPSYREGFPNVVLEAGAMGLPSIVTDINGSREIIIHGKNGIIVPPQNENELYKAMLWMVKHTEERLAMGKAAIPLIRDRFDQSFVRKCLKNYYCSIF